MSDAMRDMFSVSPRWAGDLSARSPAQVARELVQDNLGQLKKLATPEEDLARCEAVIAKGIDDFRKNVGAALLEIGVKRLYEVSGYESFSTYCREKWGLKQSRAAQLEGALEVIWDLEVGGFITRNNLPTEFQVRPLVSIPSEERGPVWEKAVERSGGNPSAPQVKAAVDEVITRNKPDPKPEPNQKGSKPEPKHRDPEQAAENWNKIIYDLDKQMSEFLISLQRRSGVIELTSDWSRINMITAMNNFKDLSVVSEKCYHELKDAIQWLEE